MARSTKPPSAVRLNLAVTLRRRGSTWPEIGRRLGCSAETVRQWPRIYSERWQQAVCRDAERAIDKADGDVVRTLGLLLKHGEGRMQFRAAKSLIDRKLGHKKCEIEAIRAANSRVGALKMVISRLEECSHGELKYIAELCLRMAAERAETLPPVRP